MNDTSLLSLIIFLPTVGAAALMLFNRKSEELMRYFALAITVVTFFLTLHCFGRFDSSTADLYNMKIHVNIPWIQTWNINYQLGVDGISLPLVVLTGLVSVLAMLASWNIEKQVKGY